jgi:excisionase family DNA binding protein
MPLHVHPTMVDYSPTEVADGGLIGLKRSAVYKAIERGELQATKDERGHFRISQAEIDRYTSARHLVLPDFSKRPTDPLLLQDWLRQRSSLGGVVNAMRHTKQEIAEQLRRGKLAKFAREVDPDGVLPADELARRVALAEKADMKRVRFAKATKKLLEQQFGNEQA